MYEEKSINGQYDKQIKTFKLHVRRINKYIATILIVTIFLQLLPSYNYFLPNEMNRVYANTDTLAPSTPSNLSILSASGSAITLVWEPSFDDAGIRKYEIYSNGALIGSTSQTNYTYSQLKEGTTYSFYVVAYDRTLNISNPSNTVTMTTELQAPEAPRNLSVLSLSGSSITLGWDCSNDDFGIRKYEIYCNDKLVGTTANTTFTYTQLKEGTTYHFYILAYDYALNSSVPSNNVSFTTDMQVPEAPLKLVMIIMEIVLELLIG